MTDEKKSSPGKETAMATWREGIQKEANGEEVVACTLSEADLDKGFDAGFGGAKGAPFTAWTPTRVLFPVTYDGAEWVGSAPRNPTAAALAAPCEHQGGG